MCGLVGVDIAWGGKVQNDNRWWKLAEALEASVGEDEKLKAELGAPVFRASANLIGVDYEELVRPGGTHKNCTKT